MIIIYCRQKWKPGSGLPLSEVPSLSSDCHRKSRTRNAVIRETPHGLKNNYKQTTTTNKQQLQKTVKAVRFCPRWCSGRIFLQFEIEIELNIKCFVSSLSSKLSNWIRVWHIIKNKNENCNDGSKSLASIFQRFFQNFNTNIMFRWLCWYAVSIRAECFVKMF